MTIGVNSTGQPTQTINVEIGTIKWDRVGIFSDKDGYSIRYRAAEVVGGGEHLELNLPGRMIKIPAEEVIKVARDMQAKQRQEPVDMDSIDHEKLLKAIVKHADDNDGTVQVLEGSVDDVKLEHFSGNTPESIHELIHFIRVNNLQDQKPWCMAWNLYQCMMIAARGT